MELEKDLKRADAAGRKAVKTVKEDVLFYSSRGVDVLLSKVKRADVLEAIARAGVRGYPSERFGVSVWVFKSADDLCGEHWFAYHKDFEKSLKSAGYSVLTNYGNFANVWEYKKSL